MTENPREDDAQTYRILSLEKYLVTMHYTSAYALQKHIYIHTAYTAFTINQEALRSRNS